MRKLKSFSLFVLFVVVAPTLWGQNNAVRVADLVAFSGDFLITSSNSAKTVWSPVGSISLPQNVAISANQAPQKWRLRIGYRVDQASPKFALQARMDLQQAQNPIFNIGWDDGRVGSRQAVTNWVQASSTLPSGQIPVSLSLTSSAGQQMSTVTITSVVLEIWQDKVSAPRVETQIAGVSDPVQRANATPRSIAAQKQAAIDNGLAFLRASSSGDTKQMQVYLSSNVLSIHDQKSINRIPQLKLKANQTFDDYLVNYQPQVLAYSEIAGLLDNWESHPAGSWQISEKSWLFVGSNVKVSGDDIFAGQPLVFVMEEEDGLMKVKAFP